MSAALLKARADLIGMARPSLGYCRDHKLDWKAVESACGGPFLAPIRVDRSWFDFDTDGVEAVIVESRGSAGKVIDLVAWLPSDPTRWWTAIGAAPVLGEGFAKNPNTGLCSEPLRIFRTPLGWLKGRCEGIALLDRTRAGRWLLDVARTVAAEDRQHAAEIHRLMKAAGPRILVKARAA